MSFPRFAIPAALGSIVLIGALAGALSLPVNAETLPAASNPPQVSVVIPDDASPPAPTTPSGSGSSGSGSGSGTSDGTPSVPAPNSDGSPVPPGQPTKGAATLTLDRETIAVDEWMLASAAGFAPGEKVQLVLYPGAVIVGTFTADAGGGFTARFRIPAGTLTGDHVAEATGWTSGYVANGEFVVVSGVLASNWLTLWWVYVVLGALLVGVVSLGFAFRRDIPGWFGGTTPAAGPVAR